MIRHKYINKILAGVLAVSMLTGQNPMPVYAEGETAVTEKTAETQLAEASVPETEAPAPQTEAPAPQTEPPAPQTEAPAPQTEAPAPQTEAPAPQTEAPQTDAPQTEAPQTDAPQTEAPQTDAPQTETEAPQTDAPQTETEAPQTDAPQTETESETTAKAGKFYYTGNGLTARLELPAGAEQPADSTLKVEIAGKDAQSAAEKSIRKVTDRGHREMTSAVDYIVTLTGKDGEITIPRDAILTVAYDKPLDLKIGEYMQGEAGVYGISGEAVKLVDVKLDQDRKVAAFKVSREGLREFAVAGVSNLINDGDKLIRKDLEKNLEDVTPFAVAANVYTSDADEEPEEIAAGNAIVNEISGTQDAELPKPQEISDALDDLSDYSVEIANAVSSDTVTVVNVYAGSDGKVDPEPLEEVLSDRKDKKDKIDVSDTMTLINVVADYAEQDLTLPAYETYNEYVEWDETSTLDTAGKLIYNVVALDLSGEYVAYTGTAKLKDAAEGTYIAAEAKKVEIDDALTGAVYADTVYAASTSQITMAAVGYDKTEADPSGEDTDPAPESGTEGGTENATEADTEEATEADTEEATEADTEEATEADTEEATEADTEETTEADTEENTEAPVSNELTLSLTAVDADKQETLLAGAEISVTKADGTALLDTEEKPLVFTTFAEAEKNLLTLDPAQYPDLADAQEAVKLVLTQTKAPEGYYSTSEPVEVTYDPAEHTLEPAQAVFNNKKQTTVMSLRVGATTEDGKKYLSGAKFSILVKETGKPLLNTRDRAVAMVISKEALTKFPIDAASFPMLRDMENGASMTLVIKETVSPIGYTYIKPAEQEVTVSKDENGNYLITPDKLLFKHRIAKNVTILIRSVDSEKTPNTVAGALFAVRDAETGDAVTMANGSNAFEIGKEGQPYKLVLDEGKSELIRDMENGTSVTLIVTELKAPDGYTFAEGTDKYITVTKGDNGELTVAAGGKNDNAAQAEQLELVFKHRKPDAAIAAGQFTAVKKNYCGNSVIYAEKGAVYYAALFKKDAATGDLSRVTDVKKIEIKQGKLDGMVTFKNLEPGTYVLRETNVFGKIVGEEKDESKAEDPFYTVYSETDTVKVTLGHQAADPVRATIENHYFKKPAGFVYTASFKITKKVIDSKGNPSTANDTFNIAVYDADTNKKVGSFTVDMTKYTSRTAKKSIVMKEEVRRLRIVEEGYDKSKYESSVDHSIIELHADQTTVPEVTVTNMKKGVVDEFGDGKAKLTLKKSVTYKGTPVRVNATYYIGIWKNADLSGDPYYIRPMTLKNASSVTADLTINLNKAKDKQQTFYFAEVTKSGKIVTSDNNNDYDISIDNKSVTLKEGQMEGSVSVVNAIRTGGRAETRLTDPTSGFAGDSAALAEAQELEKNGNSSAGTKTGDDNPILPLAIALCISAAVICSLLIILRKRRK